MNYENMLNATDKIGIANPGLFAGARFVKWDSEEKAFLLHSFENNPGRMEVSSFLDGGGLLVAVFPGTMVTADMTQQGQRFGLVPKGVLRARRDETGKAIADGQDWALGGWLMVGKVSFGHFSGLKVIFGAVGTDISQYDGFKAASNTMSRPEEFGAHQGAIELVIREVLGANDGHTAIECRVDDHQVVIQNLSRTLPQVFGGFGLDRGISEAGPKREIGVTNRGQVVKTGADALNARSQGRYARKGQGQGQGQGGRSEELTSAVLAALEAAKG
jgi:hypothetical protein